MSKEEGLSRRQLIVGSMALAAAASMPLPGSRPNLWLSIHGSARCLTPGQLERILAPSSNLFGEAHFDVSHSDAHRHASHRHLRDHCAAPVSPADEADDRAT